MHLLHDLFAGLLILLGVVAVARSDQQSIAKHSVPTPEWSSKMDGVRRTIGTLDIPYDYDTCVRRQEPTGANSEGPRLGIVVVLCNENMSLYNKIGCRGGLVHYHVYSKCGLARGDVVSAAPGLRGCLSFKESPSTVYTDLSWSKAHSEYLEHIIAKYHVLEDNLMFTKAKVTKANIRTVVDISGAVDVALSGEWAYKPLWPTKFSVSFDHCPMECNAAQFGRELCALYKRYTCEADCYSCPHDNEWMDVERLMQEGRDMAVSRCFFPNPRSTFIAAASRLRALPQSEYMWLREWIQSWQEGGAGIFRRLMGERLWPVLLGCPEDIHHNTSDGGCRADMRFPAGKRTAPPVEMIVDGLVHDPSSRSRPKRHLVDPGRHSNRHPYPHIASPKLADRRLVTFAVLFEPTRQAAAEEPGDLEDDALLSLKAAFATALQFHPSARFFAVVAEGHLASLQRVVGGENTQWFVGRLETHVVTDHPLAEHKAPAWLNLAEDFLRARLARSSGADYGHVVLLPAGTILLDDLWGAFADLEGGGIGISSSSFVAAFPAAGALEGDGPGIIALHRDRLKEAQGLVSRLILREQQGASLASLLQDLLAGCSAQRSGLGACTLSGTGDAALDGILVQLLPCEVWGAVARFDPPGAGKESLNTGDGAGGCSMTAKSRIVRLGTQSGAMAWKTFTKMREYAEPSMGRDFLLSELENGG